MDNELTLKELEELKGKVLECDGAKIKSKRLKAPIIVYCDKFGIGQYCYNVYFFKENEIVMCMETEDIDKIFLKEKAKKGKKEGNKK